jgi:NADP-dependent 3-hydroxy acid dehydrogenase YdfG
MTAKSNPSKTILITGSSTGFGRGIAEILARNGHVVFASMRDVAGRNENHADELRSKGLKVVELDVTNDASVEKGVAQVLSQAQKIDVVLRVVLPTLRKQGDGLIVNVGSILGRVTFPFFGLYGASKFAVEALTDSYR